MKNLTVSVTMPQALCSCLSSGSGRRTKRYISKSFPKAVKLEEVCDKCSLLPVGNLFNQDRREAKCPEHMSGDGCNQGFAKGFAGHIKA